MRDTTLPEILPVPVTIRLRYQMMFQLTCDRSIEVHRDHPTTVKFAKGGVFAGNRLPSGDVVVTGVYDGHPFRILHGQYLLER